MTTFGAAMSDRYARYVPLPITHCNAVMLPLRPLPPPTGGNGGNADHPVVFAATWGIFFRTGERVKTGSDIYTSSDGANQVMLA